MRSPETPAGGNFNWVAPVYDALAFVVFGRKLQRAQTVFLDRIPAGASVLIVGGGTGWLLEQVLTRYQISQSGATPPKSRRGQSRRGQSSGSPPGRGQSRPGHILYLESSAGMLNRASRRMVRKPLLGSVEFRLGDETALDASECFDVVITPFVLDLFAEETLQTHLIPRLLSALSPCGLWLVTDFVKPHPLWQKAILWSMIRFFRLTAGIETRQLADWQRLLRQAGLTLRECQTKVGGLVSTEVYSRPDDPASGGL